MPEKRTPSRSRQTSPQEHRNLIAVLLVVVAAVGGLFFAVLITGTDFTQPTLTNISRTANMPQPESALPGGN